MTDQYTVTKDEKGRVRVTRVAQAAEKAKHKGKVWDTLSTKEKLDYIAYTLGLLDDTGKVK